MANNPEEIKDLFKEFQRDLCVLLVKDFMNVDWKFTSLVFDELKSLNLSIEEFLAQLWVSKKLNSIFEEIEQKTR